MAKNKSNLNGYDLTMKMRKARRRFALSATDQALYYELMAICNEESWAKYFKISNNELCVALKITENTLVKTRQHLIDANLITFKSGKSKRLYSTYSLTTSNNEVDHKRNEEEEYQTTSTTTSTTTSNFEGNAADYNKDKLKLKLKHKPIYIHIDLFEKSENDSEKNITDLEFVQLWKQAHEHYDEELLKISRLTEDQKECLRKISPQFTRGEFKKAIKGLFFQGTYPDTRKWPTHFLKEGNFEIYLDCWISQSELYPDVRNNKKPKSNVKSNRQKERRVGRLTEEEANKLSDTESWPVNRSRLLQ